MSETIPRLIADGGQSNAEVVVNDNAKSAGPVLMYAKHPPSCSGLVWGVYGGDWQGSTIGTLYSTTQTYRTTVNLTDATTNYVVANRSTGAVSTSTSNTNWNDTGTYGRLQIVTTAGGVVTGAPDWRFQLGGIFNHSAGLGAVDASAVSYSPAVNADWNGSADPGNADDALDQLAERVTDVEAAVSGSVATDAIWDAAGDLVQGTGANTAARLALGTALQVLRVNAGATAVEWGAAAGNVATDAIWDVAGDIVYGTGANTGARLAIGTARQALLVNAGATAPEWGVVDSDDVAYAATTVADWNGSADPGDVEQALDQLAERTKDLEGAAAGSGTKTYAVFTPMTSQPPAANFATLDTRNSIAVLDFDDSTDESAFWVGVMPEAASLGSGLKIRIHWMATSATSGTVRWGAQLERMNTDLDSDSFDTVATAGTATSGTTGIATVTEITLTTIDSVAAGELYRVKVYRDADGTSGTDDVAGDAELIAVEVRSAA
jgi:hypothetical protein